MHLLIVEDDARAATLLASDLAELGHSAAIAPDGRAALVQAAEGVFDAILLDIMLPHLDGVSVAQRLRAQSIELPIVMLTALGELDQRLEGLEAGADDYLVKPAAPSEIDARLKAIMRRLAGSGSSGVLRAGDIEINEIKHRASRAGRPLVLQNMEFRLLAELVRNADSIVTRQMLYQKVWNYDFEPRTNVVEAYVRRLRMQLNQADERDPIATIRGVGYMLTSSD